MAIPGGQQRNEVNGIYIIFVSLMYPMHQRLSELDNAL